MNDISVQIDNYWAWLKDNTHVQALDDWYEITTPYLDRRNDFVQIYARHDGDDFLLTDDGYTINDLEMSGCPLDSPKRQEILRSTLNGFGVKIDGKELTIKASSHQFAIRKHNLIQAILAIGDLFYLARPHIRSLFVEDVQSWLDTHEVRYTPRITLTGKSGFSHHFEFAIPKSKDKPERLLKAVNHPDRDTVESIIMSWLDTRETRSPDSLVYAVLNDRDTKMSSSVEDALGNYDIRQIRWTEREKGISQLVA